MITKNEFRATRQARMRRISGVAPRVKPKKTSADPGGLTTGKIAASTRRKVLRGEFILVVPDAAPAQASAKISSIERCPGTTVIGTGKVPASRPPASEATSGPGP